MDFSQANSRRGVQCKKGALVKKGYTKYFLKQWRWVDRTGKVIPTFSWGIKYRPSFWSSRKFGNVPRSSSSYGHLSISIIVYPLVLLQYWVQFNKISINRLIRFSSWLLCSDLQSQPLVFIKGISFPLCNQESAFYLVSAAATAKKCLRVSPSSS